MKLIIRSQLYATRGSRSVRLGDPKLTKGTEKSTRGSRHTTGVNFFVIYFLFVFISHYIFLLIYMTGIYGSNAAGEVMPPIYCFDSSAEKSDNFQVKPSWVSGLPQVRGKYGCPTTENYESSVAV